MGAHIVSTLKKKHPNSTVSLSQVSLSNTFKQQSFNLQLQYLLDFNIFKIFKMQFSYALIAAAACAVANAVIITNGPASFVGIQAGRALNITWADAEGPVTLTLKTGEANALTTVSTIASGLSGTSYAWAIPSTLPESFYALQIELHSHLLQRFIHRNWKLHHQWNFLKNRYYHQLHWIQHCQRTTQHQRWRQLRIPTGIRPLGLRSLDDPQLNAHLPMSLPTPFSNV